jgi:diacylglycerol kinase family enzyme
MSEPSPEQPRRRMVIIVNPHATTVSDRLRQLVVYALEGRFDVEAVDTKARGHATELSREAAHKGYDVVVAFGGDGTVNEAANGLVGTSTVLSCLPGGSANVFAKLLGIPVEIIDATEHLMGLADNWRPRAIDLGVVNERCFTFASGLGLDASVVERVDAHPRLKARFGANYFAWVAIRVFLRRYLRHPPHMTVEADGRAAAGVTAVVQNGPFFTYFHDHPVALTEEPALDSGRLSASLLARASPIDLPFLAWRLLSSQAALPAHRQVNGFAAVSELSVRSADARTLPLQVDGDYIGEVSEARYSILPGALTVLA